MKKIFIAILLINLSVCLYADIIHLLPKSFEDRLDIIDPRIEDAKKRAETDSFYATLFYFMGADVEFYVGSLYVMNNSLNWTYYPPGQDSIPKDSSCIMAYNVKDNTIELIIKRWEYYYDDEQADIVKDIVYYRVLLFEKDGKLEYTCAYTTPDLNLNNYTINTAVAADKNVYAYSSPSFRSQKIIELHEGIIIKILPTILAENGPEEEPYDFWYKIELNGKQTWVYGYLIEFSNTLIFNRGINNEDK